MLLNLLKTQGNFKIYNRAIKLLHTRKFILDYRKILVKRVACTSFPLQIQKRLLNDSVKKRALEARSKLQPVPKYQNNKSCPSDPIKSNPEPEKKFKCPPPTPVTSKQYVCKKPEPKEPCGPPPEDNSNSLKILIALLVAGGVGGLIYKYMTTGPVEQPEMKCKKLVKCPPLSSEIPKHVPYLLIGGGTASFSAFRAIKSQDAKAKVLVITNEYLKPYMRPPLSKELWYGAEKNVSSDYRFKQWNGAERSLFYEPDEFYCHPTRLMEVANGGVAVVQGYQVKKVDACAQKVYLADGTAISYDKCLIATGCSPKSLDVFSSLPHNLKDKVSQVRNPCDFENLKKVAETKKSVTIVGSGFLGSELACAVANYGKSRKLEVHQVFFESGNMAKVLPEYLSKWTTGHVESQGVCVIPNTQIVEVSAGNNNTIKLTLNNGKTLLTDHVVVCAGCDANIEIAKASGLEIDACLGGFVVNAELEARRNLFVAGDAACFYDPLLGRRRVEHHDHSVVSGRLAGENMTGLKKAYKHQSMFWSDLGPDLGYEGIGLTDASLETVAVFAKPSQTKEKRNSHLDKRSPGDDNVEQISVKTTNPQSKKADNEDDNEELDFGRGVVFYLKNKKIVGILLWNIFNRIGLARQVISQNKCYDDLNEVAKLFEIHS